MLTLPLRQQGEHPQTQTRVPRPQILGLLRMERQRTGQWSHRQLMPPLTELPLQPRSQMHSNGG